MQNSVAAIQAVSTYLPDTRLTNEHLAAEFGDWDVDKIFDKTGIASRGLTAEGQCASDLGVAAAERLFASGACAPEDIDFLLFCTQSPDYLLPTTACTMQARLGLRTNCGALDYNLGCSGYIYGLALANGLIATGVASRVLLITAETYSKYIHPQDRSVRTLFGDGAAATLLTATPSEQPRIGPFVLGTDGTGAEKLIVLGGGMRPVPAAHPILAEEIAPGTCRTPMHIYMNGPDIFNFTLRMVPPMVTSLLEKANLAMADVDYFVFHQANKFMLERLRKKVGIPEDKFCIHLQEVGNTVSATIPFALEASFKAGTIKPGDTVMLVGFGVGLSWGATLVKF